MIMQCTPAIQKSVYFLDAILPPCGQKSRLYSIYSFEQIIGKYACHTCVTSRFSTLGLDGGSKKLPRP